MIRQPAKYQVSRGRYRAESKAHISTPGIWLAALAIFLACIALATWATTAFDLIAPDVPARTGTAAAMLWSRNPHYGALLTAWPPLATALQLPLVWLMGAVFSAPQFAANLLSALATAFSVPVLYKMFEALDLRGGWRMALMLLYFANPLVLLYTVSGSSNALLLSCLIFATYGFVRWWRLDQAGYIGLSGLGVTAAFLVSYWALLFAPLLAAAFIYGSHRRGAPHPWVRLTLFAMTPFYTLLFWLAFNFISMRDPLAFLHSNTLASLPGNPLNDPASVSVYALPVAFILLALLPQSTANSPRAYGVWIATLLAASLLAAGIIVLPGQGINGALNDTTSLSNPTLNLTEEHAVGDYLRAQVRANALILLDEGDNYSIIERAGHPQRFVIPSDLDYDDLVANAPSQVDYILVQKSTSLPGALRQAYPMLYEGRWLYSQLEHDFGGEMGWRLYRVSPPNAGGCRLPAKGDIS